MYYDLLTASGIKYMTTGEILTILGMSSGIFMIMAWLADLLMERLSFGVILNTILLMVGAVLGFAIMVWLGMPPTRRDYLTAVFICGLSGFIFLMALASMKRAV
jgi:uncharacterized membrane protein YeaQ/YmgE (transglycosylase-associated protein family)